MEYKGIISGSDIWIPASLKLSKQQTTFTGNINIAMGAYELWLFRQRTESFQLKDLSDNQSQIKHVKQ
jgi:hypothetical protein